MIFFFCVRRLYISVTWYVDDELEIKAYYAGYVIGAVMFLSCQAVMRGGSVKTLLENTILRNLTALILSFL